MITLQEAIDKGIPLIGQGEKPPFCFSGMVYVKAEINIAHSTILQDIMNNKLALKDYIIGNKIKHLTITFIAYPENWEGINRKEQKYYRKETKTIFLDLKISNFDIFCSATKTESIKIMAAETLRGTEKFLSSEKDFQYELFYKDLKALFIKEGFYC